MNQTKHMAGSFGSQLLSMSSATVLNIIALFIEMIVAIRVMDEASYGRYIFVITISNFIIMVVDLGFKTAVTQLIASSGNERQKQVVFATLVVRLSLMVALSILLLVGGGLFAKWSSFKTIALFLPFIVLIFSTTSLDELFNSVLQGYQFFHQLSFVIILKSLLRLGLSFVLLLVFNMGIHALFYSWIISAIVSILVQFWIIPKLKFGKIRFALIGEIVRFGFPLYLSRVMWFVTNRINIVILNKNLGAASIAFYEVGNRIPTALQRLSEAFVRVYFPKMTQHLFSEEHEEADNLFNNFTRLISFIVGLGVLTTCLFSREITTLLFSSKYLDSHTVLISLMLAFHVGLISQIIGYTLTSAGYPKLSLIENVLRAIFIVVLNLILIPRYGFNGAAIAMLIANLLSNPVCLILLKRIDMSIFRSKYWIHVMILAVLVTSNQILSFNFFMRALLILVFVVLNFIFSIIRLDEIKTYWKRYQR